MLADVVYIEDGHPEGWPLQRQGNVIGFREMSIQERRIRLAGTEYIGKRIYFVTVCAEGRAKHFEDAILGKWIVEKLVSMAARQQFVVHAYCVMPDHLHFVVEGTDDKSNLTRFVERFKQETAYEFSKNRAMRLWQHRYYDYILRRANELEDVASYVWWNPVRQRLCSEPGEYPLSGSQTIDWMRHSAKKGDWEPAWKRGACG